MSQPNRQIPGIAAATFSRSSEDRQEYLLSLQEKRAPVYVESITRWGGHVRLLLAAILLLLATHARAGPGRAALRH